MEALRILLGRAQLDAVVKPLDQEGAWDKMKDPQQHTTGVTLLSRYTHLSSVIPQSSWTVCCLQTFLLCSKGEMYDSKIVLEGT